MELNCYCVEKKYNEISNFSKQLLVATAALYADDI